MVCKSSTFAEHEVELYPLQTAIVAVPGKDTDYSKCYTDECCLPSNKELETDDFSDKKNPLDLGFEDLFKTSLTTLASTSMMSSYHKISQPM